MAIGENRREFSRIPFDVDVVITLPDGHVIPGKIRDIAAKGIFIYANENCAENTECSIKVFSFTGEQNNLLETKGKVVRSDEDGIALEFDQVDLESFEQLKKMIKDKAEGSKEE